MFAQLNYLSIDNGKAPAATNEVVYEYPKMSPKPTDPKMESCAAYGVIDTGH